MLGGAGNKPDSISSYALFPLKPKFCTDRFRLENLGMQCVLILLEKNC